MHGYSDDNSDDMFFPVQIRYSTELCFFQKVRFWTLAPPLCCKVANSDNHSFSRAFLSSSVNPGFIQGYNSILFCISG